MKKDLNCTIKKAKDLVVYGHGMHFCFGKLRQVCPVCKNTEALLFSKFAEAIIVCDQCNSRIRHWNGVITKIGTTIRGIKQNV